jgi:lysozyme
MSSTARIEAVQAKRLFDAIRIVKGAGLTQADVDRINRAIANDVAESAGTRRTSDRGIELIHSFEAFRATTYPDPGPTGKPVTGGWGTTRDEQGKALILGVTWPRDRWEALFRRDLAAKEAAVNMLLGDAPTTQSQFDALVSFAYNVGEDIDDDDIAEGLGDSTLLKKHLRGDYAGAKAEFPKWNKSNGKVLNGLIRRRAAEAELYAS